MTGTFASGLTLVGASAGSGKTHRLTQEVISAIQPSSGPAVPLEGLVAVTYTRKAQAELAARIRRTLVQAGAFGESVKLPLAMLGTVHSACLRLLEEFALDAGLSPRLEPAGGDPHRLLRESIEHALQPTFRRRMDELARRLQIHHDHRTRRSDWLRPVGDIMDLVRGNRIDASRLPEMGRRSAAGLLALLPSPVSDESALDVELRATLDSTLAQLERIGDSSKGVAKVVEEIRRARRKIEHGELAWADWVSLSKLEGTKAAQPVLLSLREAASAYERHPRLHEELREITTGLFEAARIGIDAYADWKMRRRLVDYTDMIDRALTLLADPGVARELSGRLKLVVVDEFQDTSPLQLALFVRLHALTGRSVWVGDRKQCIFEFAGADPSLMEAVSAWIAQSGGRTDQLHDNYRSRPELVSFTSELFARAFVRHGYSENEVRVTARREIAPALVSLPPLGVWWLSSGKNEEDAAALSAGVARLLRDRAATPVEDRRSGKPRDLEPGDIAVLVATNAEAMAIATALHAHGIHAALARPGLLRTPEGTLVDAALRLLLDPRDTLAAATLDALGGWNGLTPDDWLAGRLAARAHPEAPASPSEWVRAVEGIRGELPHLSPAEVLDRVILSLDAESACARWPDPAQRLANLDALRALAATYEDRCLRRCEAATPAGLLRYFDETRQPVLVADEELATDDQYVREGADVVTISTYHRAKGLEWPVVVLGSLDRKQKRSAFSACPESDRDAFDPEDPLGGRWIRYWPWPFGAATAPLEAHAADSPEGRRVADREDRERVRLLYVGFTRARDHLVLAIRKGKKGPFATWLAELRDEEVRPLLALPEEAVEEPSAAIGVGRGAGGDLSLSARVWTLAPEEASPPREETPRRFARAAKVEPRLGYKIAPSRASEEWTALPPASVTEVVSLTGRLDFAAVGGVDWETAGIALHAFFAADLDGLPESERLARARRVLAPAGLTGVVRPEDVVASSDALRAFIVARWPDARWRRELPITAFVATPSGRRRIEGTIDLLLETPAGDIVFDHKSFPGRSEPACRAKATALAPQLVAYAEALRLQGRTVTGTWFHFPVSGMLVELRTT